MCVCYHAVIVTIFHIVHCYLSQCTDSDTVYTTPVRNKMAKLDVYWTRGGAAKMKGEEYHCYVH